MFVTVEKAIALTGRNKNALYRKMAQGYLNYVLCTKGKRHIEVAELQRLYGPLNPDVAIETPIPSSGDQALFSLIEAMQTQLVLLHQKVDQHTAVLEKLQQNPPPMSQPPVRVATSRPEDDPEWPPFITCYADLAKRDQLKAKYGVR